MASNNGNAQVYDPTTGTWGSFQPAAPAVTTGGKQAGSNSANAGLPGYDVFGNPVATPTNPTDPSAVARYPTGYTAPAGGGTPSSSIDDAESAVEASTTPEDPATVQARVASQYASEISAIQSYYNGLTSQQGVTNKNNSGKTRALNATSGVLGSSFGNANDENTETANNAALGYIADEESNQEASVYGQENSEVDSELNTEKAANQTGLQNRLTYLQNAATQARSQIQTVAGTTPLESLSQDAYDSLYQQAGFNTPDEFNAFYTASAAAAAAGTKLVGDSNTGYYTVGVGANGQPTYTNVIKGTPTTFTGGQYGTYTLGADGEVTQVSPGQTTKIYSSGGQLWSVDTQTNKATPLTQKAAGVTGGKVAWGDDTSSTLAVQSWIESDNLTSYNQANGTNYTPDQMMSMVQSNPDAFVQALNQALDAGLYVPTNVSPGSSANAAAQSAQDAEDAADNTFNNTQDSGN